MHLHKPLLVLLCNLCCHKMSSSAYYNLNCRQCHFIKGRFYLTETNFLLELTEAVPYVLESQPWLSCVSGSELLLPFVTPWGDKVSVLSSADDCLVAGSEQELPLGVLIHWVWSRSASLSACCNGQVLCQD